MLSLDSNVLISCHKLLWSSGPEWPVKGVKYSPFGWSVRVTWKLDSDWAVLMMSSKWAFRMTIFLMKWRAKGRNKVEVEHYLGIDDFVGRIWLNCLTRFRLNFFVAFAMLIRCFICLFPQEGYDYFEKWEDHIGLKESVWSCPKHSSIRCWHIV